MIYIMIASIDTLGIYVSTGFTYNKMDSISNFCIIIDKID